MTLFQAQSFPHPYRVCGCSDSGNVLKRAGIVLLILFLMNGCASLRPVPLAPDADADAIITRLQETNAALSRFKAIGRIRIVTPDSPVQSYRVAIAGHMKGCLRIDLLSPVGGSAATFSSDGRHFFMIQQTPSVEYHKKKAGSGSLHRLVGMDVRVSDLLTLISGQIPIDPEYISQMAADTTALDEKTVNQVDRKGRVRQRIRVDHEEKPVEVIWFDTGEKPVYTLYRSGEQIASGFVFPRQIELFTPDGHRLTVMMDRYFPDAPMDDDLFRPAPPSDKKRGSGQ